MPWRSPGGAKGSPRPSRRSRLYSSSKRTPPGPGPRRARRKQAAEACEPEGRKLGQTTPFPAHLRPGRLLPSGHNRARSRHGVSLPDPPQRLAFPTRLPAVRPPTAGTPRRGDPLSGRSAPGHQLPHPPMLASRSPSHFRDQRERAAVRAFRVVHEAMAALGQANRGGTGDGRSGRPCPDVAG
jgi:hypothetical protein